MIPLAELSYSDNGGNMGKQFKVLPLFLLVSALLAQAQSGAVIPQHGAGHTEKPSCVILKRMGPADQVTSHFYSWGIRGKQFQYIEGNFPDGFPFHGRMTDHDVRNLQAGHAEIIILEQKYTADDLKQARAECRKLTDKNPNQATENATIEITSSPTGADIELDGEFVGNTPSPLSVAPGEHTVKVIKTGYTSWERKVKLSPAGTLKIAPELERVAQTAPQ